jgi:hypothetical protein
LSVDVQIAIPNLGEMIGRLEAFRIDQLPYALSVGMNRAAKDARDLYEYHLAYKFDLVSRNMHKAIGPFGQMSGGRVGSMGVPDTAAQAARAIANGWSHKSQWPNLQVEVGTESHSIARQEFGGTKPNLSREVWIPTRHVKRSSSGKKINRHAPSKLRAKMAPGQTKTGRTRRQTGKHKVFRRGAYVYEREAGSDRALPLYLVKSLAKVPPRLALEEHIVDTYNAKLWPRFSQAMGDALKNPKKAKR